MIRFPDVESILLEALERFGPTTLLTHEDIYDEDLKDEYGNPVLPSILIYVIDGDQRGAMHRTTFASIVVAHTGRDDAVRLSEEIADYLTHGPTISSEGALDSATCTTVPRKVVQAMDALVFCQADYAIETRGH